MADPDAAGIPDWDFRHADGLLPGVVASAVGYAASGIDQEIHRGLPSPYLTFIVTLDEPVVTGFAAADLDDGQALSADVLAAGLHTVPAYVRQPRSQTGIQLAVYPSAARRIFGVPSAELARASLDGTDLLGRQVLRLREQLTETDDWQARFSLLQRFLRDRDSAAGRAGLRPDLDEAWIWLTRHRGRGTIGGLADHVHLSRRQLQELFTREFGVGPKAFNRLLRYQRVKAMITERVGTGRRLDLARISYECGYADQAHLTREFVGFTGISPTRWVAEEFGNIRAGGHHHPDALDPPKASSRDEPIRDRLRA